MEVVFASDSEGIRYGALFRCRELLLGSELHFVQNIAHFSGVGQGP